MSVKISELPVLATEDVAAGDVVAIVDSSEGVTKQVDLSGVLAGGGSGGGSGRNAIINGSGRINQRGYTSGTATTSANQFTLDRWFVVTSGQSLAFTGDDSRREMTAPAGGVSQVIEGKNIVGGTYVLNWEGAATATVNGTARTKGESFTLPANTNATVTFSSGTFAGVQLEAGPIATPFERRPVGTELALCQRYYQALPATTWRMCGTSSGSIGFWHTFLVEMRATPAIGSVSVSAVVNASALTFTDSNTSGFASRWASGDSTIHSVYQFGYTADAELTS